MWPAIQALLRVAGPRAPYIFLPITIAVGFIGYNFEYYINRDKREIDDMAIKDRRQERMLKRPDSDDPTSVPSLKSKSSVPKSSLDRNDPRELNTVRRRAPESE